MKPIIEVNKLTKMYGVSRGVTDISLSVAEGAIFGFLGPNGAGKSTTINMLLGLIHPTSGDIRIFDKPLDEQGIDIRREVGFLPSDMALDKHLTGWQQLAFFGQLRGDFDPTYVRELAKRLDCNLNRKIRTLSRGNRQKVGLIQALMHKPKLLILDEPTSGLDPLIQAEFNEIILDHKKAGRTTFISSHVLSEIQELCDHVAFIRQGKIVANATMDELSKISPKQATVVSSDKKLGSALQKLSGVSNFISKDGQYLFRFTGDSNALIKLLSNYSLSDFSLSSNDLESTFMTYYEEESTEKQV